MANTESKRSVRPTQPNTGDSRRSKLSNIKTNKANTTSSSKARTSRAASKLASRRLPASLRFTTVKRGQTTIRRYPGRSF